LRDRQVDAIPHWRELAAALPTCYRQAGSETTLGEDSDNSFNSSGGDQAKVAKMDVLVRINQSAVDKIRFVSAGCQLDAGGCRSRG
jgi:hypothetical protein